jgi:hypothetical protein
MYSMTNGNEIVPVERIAMDVGTNLDPSLSPNCPPCCTRSDVPVIAYLCDSSLLPCQFLLHIYCTVTVPVEMPRPRRLENGKKK